MNCEGCHKSFLFTPSHNDPSLHHQLTTDWMNCPERVQFNLEAQLYSHWILYGRLEWHVASSCLMAKWCNRPQVLNNWNYKSYYPMDATLTRSWVDYNKIHPKPPFLRSYSIHSVIQSNQFINHSLPLLLNNGIITSCVGSQFPLNNNNPAASYGYWEL